MHSCTACISFEKYLLFNELLQIVGCSDIDECTDNSTYTSNYCNNLASCTNNVGSWTCTCNTGNSQRLQYQVEAVSLESKFFWNPILILWAKEDCQAELLNIILKRRCPLTSLS